MPRRPKKTSAIDLIVKGSMGKFSISQGDYSSVDVQYIQTHIDVSKWGDHNEKLLQNLAPVREVFDVRDLDFEQIMQRDIDDGRVSTELIPYILGESSTGLVKLFPPIIVVVLPREQKQPGDYYPKVTSAEIESDGDTYFSVRSGPVGSEVFEFRQWVCDGVRQDHDHAELRLNTTRSALVIVDGQHRAMALLALYRNMNRWPEGTRAFQPFYERWTPEFIKSFDLSEVKLPVLFCAFPQLDESTDRPPMKVHEACRAVFLALNKNAKKVTRARNFLLDDYDIVSVFMRSALSRIKALDNLAKETVRIWNIELDTARDKNKLYSHVAVSSVTHLYHLIERLVMDDQPSDTKLRVSGVKLGKRTDLSRCMKVLRVLDKLPSSKHDSKRRTCDNDTLKILECEFEERFGRIIVKLLSDFGPYEANNLAAWDLNESLKSSAADVAGVVRAILFDGQGLDRVFEGYREALRDEMTEQLASDGKPDPHLSSVKRTFDGRAAALNERLQELEDNRLNRLLASLPEKFRESQAVRASISAIYKHTFTSAAFQHALLLTFFAVIERLEDRRIHQGGEMLTTDQLDRYFGEYLEAVNGFCVPSNVAGLENLIGVMSGSLIEAEDGIEIVQSASALRKILIPAGLDPKEWPKFRVVLLELWRSQYSEVDEVVAGTRAELRRAVFDAFVKRSVQVYAHEHAVSESRVAQDEDAYTEIKRRCAEALCLGLSQLGADASSAEFLEAEEPIPPDPDELTENGDEED